MTAVMRTLSRTFPLLCLALLAVLPASGAAFTLDRRPVCEAAGTKSEGWYQSGIRVAYARCAGCLAFCGSAGTDAEGWYSWCDGSVISREPCAPSVPTFADVPQRHPLHAAIAHTASLGLVEGYAVERHREIVREYRPQQTINRAEFAKILMGAVADAEERRGCTEAPFTDADPAAWYAPFLCMAERHGIMTGYPDGTVRPARPISFVEAAAVISRALALPAPPAPDGEPWYRRPVEALAVKQAVPPDIASFDALLTRGQMADILYRLHVPDVLRPALTYAQLRERSQPPPAPSPPSSGASASSVPSSAPSPGDAMQRLSHPGGLFSLELPSTWQARSPDGTRAPLSVLAESISSFETPSGGLGMAFSVFGRQALEAPAHESMLAALRRTIFAPLPDSAFETISYPGWMLTQVRVPGTQEAPIRSYALFTQGDTAVLLGFPAEDDLAVRIVASFRWGAAASLPAASGAASSASGMALPPPSARSSALSSATSSLP